MPLRLCGALHGSSADTTAYWSAVGTSCSASCWWRLAKLEGLAAPYGAAYSSSAGPFPCSIDQSSAEFAAQSLCWRNLVQGPVSYTIPCREDLLQLELTVAISCLSLYHAIFIQYCSPPAFPLDSYMPCACFSVADSNTYNQACLLQTLLHIAALVQSRHLDIKCASWNTTGGYTCDDARHQSCQAAS